MSKLEQEQEQLNELDSQSEFYLELYDVLTRDKTKISMSDWYQFVINNKKKYLEYSILSLKNSLEAIDRKKDKKILKILKDEDFRLYTEALTKQLLKESDANEQILKKSIENEKKSTLEKISEVLSLNKQQEIIIKKARQLEQKIFNLEEEIEDNKEIIKKQSDNLKENIWLKDKNIFLKNKQEELIKLWRQFNELVLEWKKLNILLNVNNWRWEVKFNSIAIDATNNFSVITPSKSFPQSFETWDSATIIKTWDSSKISKFQFKEIQDSDESKVNQSNKQKTFEDMLEHIKELELENDQLLFEKQEKADFETVIENLKKEHQEELDEIKKTLETVLEKKDRELQNAVQAAISKVHQQHTKKLFETIKKED